MMRKRTIRGCANLASVFGKRILRSQFEYTLPLPEAGSERVFRVVLVAEALGDRAVRARGRAGTRRNHEAPGKR